jgi:hypothetical protein
MSIYILLLVTLVALASALLILLRIRKEQIFRYLLQAERGFNSLVSAALENASRQARARERLTWIPTPLRAQITVNLFNYQTVEHLIAESNNRELNEVSLALDRAATTAQVLIELYDGNIRTAQSIIERDASQNGGNTPFVEAGISRLVGMREFNRTTNLFPREAGVSEWLLKIVVRERSFPREVDINLVRKIAMRRA